MTRWWTLTDSTEYDAWKRVTQNELKNTRDEQQKSTKEDDGSAFLVRQQTVNLGIFVSISYMNASPFPPDPCQAIRQHESGVVVITNPPNALKSWFQVLEKIPWDAIRRNELTMV